MEHELAALLDSKSNVSLELVDFVLHLNFFNAQVLLLGPEHASFEKVIRNIEHNRLLLRASFVIVLVLAAPNRAKVVQGQAKVTNVFVIGGRSKVPQIVVTFVKIKAVECVAYI